MNPYPGIYPGKQKHISRDKSRGTETTRTPGFIPEKKQHVPRDLSRLKHMNKISKHRKNPPKIVSTADGSSTMFSSQFDEHYHSVHGAITESNHVFIQAGFHYLQKPEICLFEIGFGTGLNALLTLQEAIRTKRNVHYFAVEKYPVMQELIAQLSYPEDIQLPDKEIFTKIHACQWHKNIVLHDYFTLHKIFADFTDFSLSGLPIFDLVYFDAFSPEKQPEMWSDTVFHRLFAHLNTPSALTTYCAKGLVKRKLRNAGFLVKRLPGPPRKHHILRATKG